MRNTHPDVTRENWSQVSALLINQDPIKKFFGMQKQAGRPYPKLHSC